MLAPNAVSTKETLASIYSQRLTLNADAMTCQSTRLGKVPTDPDWLHPVRRDLDQLREAGNAWTLGSPDFVGKVPARIVNVSTTFQAFAEAIDGLLAADKVDVHTLIELLKAVKSELDAAATESTKIAVEWNDRITQFRNVTPLLEKSIAAGWQALSEEEQKIVEIAETLVSLQDEVAGLSESVDSSVISGGKSVVSSSVSIVFKLVTATGEASVPYLSLVTMAFTIGKMYYDIIKDTEKVAEDLARIAQLQTEASEEAQAAAATKMVLQLLYQMELRFAAVATDMPALARIWSSESDKIDTVIQGLEAGADPKMYFDIVQIGTAATIWKDLQDFAEKMVRLERTEGVPVEIDTAAGTITKGDARIPA